MTEHKMMVTIDLSGVRSGEECVYKGIARVLWGDGAVLYADCGDVSQIHTCINIHKAVYQKSIIMYNLKNKTLNKIV